MRTIRLRVGERLRSKTPTKQSSGGKKQSVSPLKSRDYVIKKGKEK